MDDLFFKVYRNIYLRNLIFNNLFGHGQKYNEITDIKWILTHNHSGLFWEKKHLINKKISLALNQCIDYKIMCWLHKQNWC